MNNSTLRASVNELNKATANEFIVNSFDMGDSDKTQYGLVRKTKGTMDIVLDAKYTKREIYYHIQGFLKLYGTLPKPTIEKKKTTPKKVKSKKEE